MRASGRGGQHTAEFAILIGLTATAAIMMQHFVHDAVKQGVIHTTNLALGAPGCLDTDADGECDCLDLDQDGKCDDETLKELDVHSTQAVDEQGDAAFHRATTSQSEGTGHSVNEDVRLRFFPP